MQAKKGKLIRRLSILKSLRSKLIAYMGVILVLFVGIVLLANMNYLSFFNEYDKLYEKYNALNGFYKSANRANDNVKAFLYSGSYEDYVSYESNLKEAEQLINYLKDTASDEDTRWEYIKLSRILETYTETSQKAMIQKIQNGEYSFDAYEKVMKINRILNDTIVNYFDVIIMDMNSGREKLQSQWDTQKTVIMVVLAGIFVFCTGFSLIFMRNIDKPISYLVKSVQRLSKGEYDIPKIHSGSTELNILLDSFHNMARSLGYYVKELKDKSELQKQLLQQENDNLRMRTLLRETELKALQGQMNPHFLMNTLSIISKMAYIEGAKQTTELMEATTDLLKYSLEKSSKVSDFKSEIEAVRNYFFIQEKRFGSRITFSIEIRGDIPNIKMPALVIQPIIENSVKHGVGDMVDGGFIRVKCWLENNYVNISVEDNGKGIDSETIESILLEDSLEGSKSAGIGILNVKKRLEMFFGEKGLLGIDSSTGVGTIVSIRLPLNKGLEVN